MSDSEGSTILLSPGSAADDLLNANEGNVFAWLRPHSDTACAAFDASVNSALTNRDKYEHIRRFLHLTGREKRAPSVYTEHGSEPEDDRRPLQWSGAFKLSLKLPPRDPANGWYMGTSRGRRLQEIDFLLAPPIDKWASLRIAGKHARLFFHEQSCRMVLEARHTVTLTKNGVAVIAQSKSRVVEHGELIELGHCSYIFECTELSATSAFKQELVAFMKEQRGPQWSLHQLLSPDSVGTPVPLGDYRCSPSAFAQGTFGKISAGWTHEGRPVAIKVLKNPRETEVIGHKRMMEYIGHHPNIIELQECVSHFDAQVPDAYCVYSPLAVASITHLLGTYEFDLSTQIVLSTDFLNTLDFLHRKGIMHRDINPNNLVVTSFDDPRGLIIDLDSATAQNTSTDHNQGTRPYLAPEIISLKENGTAGYDKSVDIWALGLSIFAIHTGQKLRWSYTKPGGSYVSPMVTAHGYDAYEKRITQRLQATEDPSAISFLVLIIQMTKYRANTRVPASVALGTATKLREGRQGRIVLKLTQKRPEGPAKNSDGFAKKQIQALLAHDLEEIKIQDFCALISVRQRQGGVQCTDSHCEPE